MDVPAVVLLKMRFETWFDFLVDELIAGVHTRRCGPLAIWPLAHPKKLHKCPASCGEKDVVLVERSIADCGNSPEAGRHVGREERKSKVVLALIEVERSTWLAYSSNLVNVHDSDVHVIYRMLADVDRVHVEASVRDWWRDMEMTVAFGTGYVGNEVPTSCVESIKYRSDSGFDAGKAPLLSRLFLNSENLSSGPACKKKAGREMGYRHADVPIPDLEPHLEKSPRHGDQGRDSELLQQPEGYVHSRERTAKPVLASEW